MVNHFLDSERIVFLLVFRRKHYPDKGIACVVEICKFVFFFSPVSSCLLEESKPGVHLR